MYVFLLGMRVQNKRLFAFEACIFDENSSPVLRTLNAYELFRRHTRIKQSDFTLSRQTRLDKVAVHFLSVYPNNEQL